MNKKLVILLIFAVLFVFFYLVVVFIEAHISFQDPELIRELTKDKLEIDSDNPFKTINIEPNSTISSPFTIVGEIDNTYMFEGVFPVNLKDETGQTITSVLAKQTPPSNWTTDDFVKFSAVLTFSTNAKGGIVIFSNDNPSGLPEYDKSYSIPVRFE